MEEEESSLTVILVCVAIGLVVILTFSVYCGVRCVKKRRKEGRRAAREQRHRTTSIQDNDFLPDNIGIAEIAAQLEFGNGARSRVVQPPIASESAVQISYYIES